MEKIKNNERNSVSNYEPLNILYAVYGDKFVDEALTSIESLKSVKGFDLRITVASNPAGQKKFHSHGIDTILITGVDTYGFKIKAINDFKEEKFIFIDSDTYILGLPNYVEELNNLYPICGVVDPLLNCWDHNAVLRPPGWNKEASKPEINTGFLMINRSHPSYKDFSALWYELHEELIVFNSKHLKKNVPDQASFMEALYRSGVNVFQLDSRFNLRVCYFTVVMNVPYVIHSHVPSAAKIAKRLSKNKDMALVFPWGLVLKRRGILNRSLFAIYRYLFC